MQESTFKDRNEYSFGELLEENLNKDPFVQFGLWLQEAKQSKEKEPNAMTISTVDQTGMPTCRIVLLKKYSEQGLIFFTNYESEKAKHIEENPKASALFFWPSLERQARLEGFIQKTSSEESNSYFRSRPRESKINAWASPQSSVIESKEYLYTKQAEYKNLFKEVEEIKRPKNWGGFCLVPKKIEFWQGGKNRLNDRILFSFIDEKWKIERLAP